MRFAEKFYNYFKMYVFRNLIVATFNSFWNLQRQALPTRVGLLRTHQKKMKTLPIFFFAGLAAKVKAANMPPSVLNRLEAKLAASVFAEIDRHFSQQQ